MTHLLVDTGFLVALYIRGDSLHQAAVGFLKGNRLPLQTVAPVIVETCFFLDAKGKAALLTWIAQGGLAVADIPTNRYPDLADYIRKYADQDIDLADAALVWLASQTGHRSRSASFAIVQAAVWRMRRKTLCSERMKWKSRTLTEQLSTSGNSRITA